MRPKAENVFLKYDLDVKRTWKGRGAILCEASEGLFQLKEWTGHNDKLVFQDELLSFLRENGFDQVERILKNKEGEFVTKQPDGTNYFVKSYVEGQECKVESQSDCIAAMELLSKYHEVAAGFPNKEQFQVASLEKEFEKRNRELKKVRRFLKEKGQKNEFELFLQQTYDFYLQKALQVTQDFLAQRKELVQDYPCIPCHGDFQYHNVVFDGDKVYLLHFEKCVWDNRIKDLYHFLRKTLEKHDWDVSFGSALLEAYEKNTPLTKTERNYLYFRFLYPEKFWKIVNYYYNARKVFIPAKNFEKLCVILEQEDKKEQFLKTII